jgi:hypothetical protein
MPVRGAGRGCGGALIDMTLFSAHLLRVYVGPMAFFLFLFALYFCVAPFIEDGMPGGPFMRFCGVVFGAFCWAALLAVVAII